LILRRRKFAFTLVELLVVTVILAVLTALLFPVFREVENASRATVCASNFRQVGLAAGMYMEEYEEKFMPVSDQPGVDANSRTDHTWVQVVLPYIKNFSVFHCPANQTGDADISTFDQDLVPGDTYSELYTASLHVNTGYNYQYLAPILLENGQWSSQPRMESEVREPSRTIMFVDSKWSLKNSDTSQGGSWLVVPPCRYASSSTGSRLDTFLDGQQAEKAFVLDLGWFGDQQFGGAWPWHMGRMTVARVDGSVTSLTPSELSAGCDTRSRFANRITDPKLYAWDSF
jgi:prepilin-type N-terminal cleavage/methylation domain-containing protein